MSIFKIAAANLRGKKSVAFSLTVLIFIAAALFNVGLTLFSTIDGFFLDSNEALGGSHYCVRFPGSTYEDKYLDFFLNDSRVEIAEVEEAVLLDKVYYPAGGMLYPNFFCLEEPRSIKGFQIQPKAQVPDTEAVYLPGFMEGLGYTPGSDLTLRFKKQDFTLKVAGYTQSTWFASSLSSIINAYLPRPAYEQLYARFGGGRLLSVRFHDPADLDAVREDFKKATGIRLEAAGIDAQVMEFTLEDLSSGCTMLVSAISAIVLAFSVIIVLVVIVVIKFRIQSHIETQMHNIGALEAMGYTGRQIQWSIAMEFLLIGAAGVFLGIFSSYAIINGMSSLISASMGIAWKGGLHLQSDLISAAAILAIILVSALRAANKAAKLTPIVALRGGISSHHFSKNHVPLDKGALPLSPALAIKTMCFHLRTYLMVGVIFTGVAFASAFAIIVYQNLGINDDLAMKMTGYELSDVTAYTAAHADFSQVRQALEAMPEVEQTSLFDTTSVEVDDAMVSCYLSDDFTKLKTIEAYEGVLPRYDNEIVISGTMARSMKKEIGDTIEVTFGDVTAAYIISGFSQSFSNFGRQCFLTLDGIRRIQPTFDSSSIQIYLRDGVNEDAFIKTAEETFSVLAPSSSLTDQEEESLSPEDAAREKAEEKLSALMTMYGVDSAQYALMVDGELLLFGDTNAYQLDHLENNLQLIAASSSSLTTAIQMMSIILLISTLCIISLVLYMVIRSMLVKRRREFGIYKAIGYTSRQLMLQIAISFLPSAFVGVLCGSTAAVLGSGPLMAVLLGGMGISRLDFEVPVFLLLAMGCSLLLFSFLLSMLVSRKIHKISVYGLLTEA